MPLLATLASVAAVASPAPAAPAVPAGAGPAGPTVTLGLSCYPPVYQTPRRAQALYAGFTPGAALTVGVDARILGRTRADAAGGGAFAWSPPVAPATSRGGEAAHTMTVAEGTSVATRRFNSTAFTAGFRPSSGDPRRLRTRFSAYGFGAGRTLYLHYVPPGGRRSALDRPIGRLGGACGKLRSAAKRLFPFNPKAGRWVLQFDTRRGYSRRSVPRYAVNYLVIMVVRRRG